MPISSYVRTLREKIGYDLLLLPSVTVALFDEQKRLLLAQGVDTNFWMTIGGALDPGEEPSDAAMRECWEETGLLVEPVRIIGVFGGPGFRVTYPNGDITSYVSTMFEVRQVGGEASPDGLETSALRFVTRSEAASLPMRGLTGDLIARAFDYAESGTTYFAAPRWRPDNERERQVAAAPLD